MAGLLVTGFGPFPGVRVNPTDRLAHAVARRLRLGGTAAQGLTLPVTYGGGLALLRRNLADDPPQALLMLGVGSRLRWVRVERFARDNPSILHADAGGSAAPAVRGTGLPMKARAPLEAALAALLRHGIRARLSPSAGRYLCNAAYATGLNELPGRPVLFVHVPRLTLVAGETPRHRQPGHRPRFAPLVAALADIARLLARHRA
jgi:pyroglutamyl-peptidase